MSPSRLVSKTEEARIKPFSFDRSTVAPINPPSSAAVHLAVEAERRSLELAEQFRAQAEREGFDQGMRSARDEMIAAQDLLDQTIGEFKISTETAIADLTEASLRIGIAIAEAILEHQLDLDPTIMSVPIEAAIHELAGDGETIVRLNPVDSAELAKRAGSIQATGVRVIDDPTVGRGDCRVESPLRVAIDGIYKRLDDIKASVEMPAGPAPEPGP